MKKSSILAVRLWLKYALWEKIVCVRVYRTYLVFYQDWSKNGPNLVNDIIRILHYLDLKYYNPVYVGKSLILGIIYDLKQNID